MKITPFTSSMKDQVCDLILSIQKEEFEVDITLEEQPDLQSLRKSYQSGKGGFWVALDDDDTVVGTIGLMDIGHQTLALRKMFVRPDFRGREIGTAQKLLDFAMTHAREKRLARILIGSIDTYKAAQNFYVRNGFSEIKKSTLPSFFPLMAVDNKFYEIRLKN